MPDLSTGHPPIFPIRAYLLPSGQGQQSARACATEGAAAKAPALAVTSNTAAITFLMVISIEGMKLKACSHGSRRRRIKSRVSPNELVSLAARQVRWRHRVAFNGRQ